MTLEIIALVVNAIISIIVPFVVLGVTIRQNKDQWKGVLAAFLCGGLVYIAMQWGVKEHGLTWLFNNNNIMDFAEQHYIFYMLLIALVGAALTVFGQVLVVAVPFRKMMTAGKAISFSIGYSMVEATWLVGVSSINTLVEMLKGTEVDLDTSVVELFLSGYERILFFVIEMAITLILIYFVQHRMAMKGLLIALLCYTLVFFLPGFFIAFSLPEYLEVFSRSTTLVMVYIVLTASAFASIVIMKVCRNLLDID